MWKEMPSCRKHPCCPLARLREEHLICLIYDYHSGRLPCGNKRIMPNDLALQIIRTEYQIAGIKKKPLLVQLLGGDPVNRFYELKALCEHTWKEMPNVAFEMTIEKLFWKDREKETWWVDHSDHLRGWVFRQTITPDDIQFALKYAFGVEYCVCAGSNEQSLKDIEMLLAEYIPLRITYQDVSDQLVFIDAAMEFENAANLPFVIETVSRLESILRQEADEYSGKCYDTSGYGWPCVALSPVALHFSEMNEDLLNDCMEDTSAMAWVCPGELFLHPLKQERKLKKIQMVRQSFKSWNKAMSHMKSVNPNLDRLVGSMMTSAIKELKRED